MWISPRFQSLYVIRVWLVCASVISSILSLFLILVLKDVLKFLVGDADVVQLVESFLYLFINVNFSYTSVLDLL